MGFFSLIMLGFCKINVLVILKLEFRREEVTHLQFADDTFVFPGV